MLAYQKLPDLSKLRYPIYASPKLDGVRALVKGGKLLSRKLLPFPNKFVSGAFSHKIFEGLDGELILGDPTSETCRIDTSQALRTIDGEPDVKFWAFDVWDSKLEFRTRTCDVHDRVAGYGGFKVVPHTTLKSEFDVLEYEKEMLDLGYEGLILRAPTGPYKFGRSTLREGYLLKLKRFVDAEATIVGFEEELRNDNKAKRDKLGRTKRSSHKENLHGKGTLGAFLCESPDFPGQQFEVGVGLTDKFAAWAWEHRAELMGKTLTYKHFPKGGKKKPQHAVFLALRDEWDMS